jgi:phosphatidylglycerol---prolipoprotein diacylglyceryl transferase
VLPYIDLPELKLGPIPIHWFGILVATAVLVGISLARWRAPRHGLDRDRLESFINWMLVGGFLGAHVFDSLFYHPGEVLRRPWSLLFIWEGLSSFGGFLGALIGVLLWRRTRHDGGPILP